MANNQKLSRRTLLQSAAGLAMTSIGGRGLADTAASFTRKNYLPINGIPMAYVEVGEGDSIVFMHGNPTSSYLWRNIMPRAESFGRLIAPDMVGMGDSGKLPDSGPGRYSFAEHSRYLDGLFDELDLGDNITLVVHDWGGPLGFHWANRYRDRIKGIAYMETSVRPSAPGTSTEGGRRFTDMFKTEKMEQQVLENNFFVESLMFGGLKDNLTEADKDVYRKPYLTPGESRRPTLDWPRQIVVDGEPADLYVTLKAATDWMSTNDIPKLFINAEPGITLTGENREYCRQWHNQVEVTVPGTHFIQEQSSVLVGTALADWLGDLNA